VKPVVTYDDPDAHRTEPASLPGGWERSLPSNSDATSRSRHYSSECR